MKHINERLARVSRRLDPLWWLVGRLILPRSRGAMPSVPRSVLLVDLHLLGDMVMLTPLLRVIRRVHPHAKIGLMAGPWGREILAETGLVDEFIILRAPWISKQGRVRGIVELIRAVRSTRAHRWDWGIDVRGDVRNVLLLSLARASRRIAFNFTGGATLLTDVVPDDGVLRHSIDHHAAIAQHLQMTMTPEETVPRLAQLAIGAAKRRSQAGIVGFHFGASMPLRRMPLDEACELLSFVRRQGAVRLILVDAPDVQLFNDAVLAQLNSEGVTTIERWAGDLAALSGFLRTLDYFYAMDSGPAHLAAALGVRTTVFFGPHVSLAVAPRGPGVTIVERHDLPCRPCGQHRCINPNYQQCLTGIVRLLEPPP